MADPFGSSSDESSQEDEIPCALNDTDATMDAEMMEALHKIELEW